MFPLQSALMPGVAAPLRIFEPRYLQLISDALASDGTFGIVLIERGSEVGGGDTRFGVGTLVRIIRNDRNSDATLSIVVGGDHRVRIEEWLADNPYPLARTTPYPDLPTPPGKDLDHAFRLGIAQLRRHLAYCVEAGMTVPPATFEMSDDPVAGSYLLSALAPIGTLDSQDLLEAPSAFERLDLLSRLISERENVM